MRRPKKRENTTYALGGMLGLFSFLIFSIFSLSVANHYLLGTDSLASVISAVLTDLTNGDRSANSLRGLTVNPTLTAVAQAKADDMATRGYFAHVSPDGKDSWYWFKESGYKFLYAGENLAVDFSDSVDVERAWMNSPTHRQNILDGHFTEIGIAVAQGAYEGRPTTFVVQMFGTPRTKSDLVLGTPTRSETVSEASLPIQSQITPTEPTRPALATTVKPPVTPAQKVITETGQTVSSAEAQVLGTGAGAITRPQASWWQLALTSPKTMLRYAFYALAFILLIALVYVTQLEFHRRHLRHVAAAMLLMILMSGLFIFADLILFSDPVIAAFPSV